MFDISIPENRIRFFLTTTSTGIMGRQLLDRKRPGVSPEDDPSTLSNYKAFQVINTRLDLRVSFDEERLSGSVELSIIAKSAQQEIVLDTSFIHVIDVTVNDVSVPFILKPRVEPLGSALCLAQRVSQGGEYCIKIAYSTTSRCTALQWLKPEQTAGTHCYLFSQCEAIHARSLMPCFDTPSIKSTFHVSIHSPQFVVCSGRPVGSPQDCSTGKTYNFVQPLPIPSYLFAIASGNISFGSIGPRSLVYTEPEKLSACKYEFEADMERFITTAESLVGVYPWGSYNILVLPPSFPYGGMENPNMTFATPTIVSGDRQNVDVIAHELAHSWAGNLVTNASWEHFWLNEGWTVYLERRILGALHGEAYRQFEALLGWTDLEESVKSLGDDWERYSPLVVNLHGLQDPDDAFSSVPYERGFNLLYKIETQLGGTENFDPFIRYYFNHFRGKSLDTYQFVDCLYDFYPENRKELDTIDWDLWFFTPGLPPKPHFDTSLVDTCYLLADKWQETAKNHPEWDRVKFTTVFSSKDVSQWTAKQSVVFLDTLVNIQSDKFVWSAHSEAVEAMNLVYGDFYPVSRNAEVLFRWLRLTVAAQLSQWYPRLAEWLGTVGRMKFVRPGYLMLAGVDRQLALDTFRRFRDTYHPICRALVEKDLGLTKGGEK